MTQPFNIKIAKDIITAFVTKYPTAQVYQLEPAIRKHLYDTFEGEHKLYHTTNLLFTINKIKRTIK